MARNHNCSRCRWPNTHSRSWQYGRERVSTKKLQRELGGTDKLVLEMLLFRAFGAAPPNDFLLGKVRIWLHGAHGVAFGIVLSNANKQILVFECVQNALKSPALKVCEAPKMRWWLLARDFSAQSLALKVCEAPKMRWWPLILESIAQPTRGSVLF